MVEDKTIWNLESYCDQNGSLSIISVQSYDTYFCALLAFVIISPNRNIMKVVK